MDSSFIFLVVLFLFLIKRWIAKTIGRHLSFAVILQNYCDISAGGEYHHPTSKTENISSPGFPQLHVQFVNVSEMFERHRDQIDAMVNLFTTAGVTLLMPGLI